MRPKVVIIGHSFSSRLGIIRSVAQLGCEVIVVVMTRLIFDGKAYAPKKPIDCYSKYVSKILYCERNDKVALIRLLLNNCTDSTQKVVLIPDSDDTVVAIDNNQAILSPFFVFPHIGHCSGAIEWWMDKMHQKQLAKEIGLKVAKGEVITIINGSYSIPDDISYPCFPKPVATMNGGKGGMHQCNTKEELTEALDFIIRQSSPTLKVLVEDYKAIHQEYALLGFSDGNAVCIPGILKIIAVSERNKGIARQGMVMPIGDLQWLVDLFKQYVLKIGYVGVFDIDFFESGEEFYFCEINLRYGGSGYAMTMMGVNLPAMLVSYLTGNAMSVMTSIIAEKAIYVNERMCLDDYYYGHISLKEYNTIISKSDIHFIPDSEDPLPEKQYQKEFRNRIVRKNIKKILKLFHLS